MRPRLTPEERARRAEERAQRIEDAHKVREMMQHPGWDVLMRVVSEQIEQAKEAMVSTPGISIEAVEELQKVVWAWRTILNRAGEIVEEGFRIERIIARKEGA